MDQERIWHYFQNESPELFRQGDGRIRFLVREILSRLPKNATVLNVGTPTWLPESQPPRTTVKNLFVVRDRNRQ